MNFPPPKKFSPRRLRVLRVPVPRRAAASSWFNPRAPQELSFVFIRVHLWLIYVVSSWFNPPARKTLRISLPQKTLHTQPQESVRLTKPKQKTPTAQVRKKTLRISPKKSAQVRKLQPLLKLMRILAHS